MLTNIRSINNKLDELELIVSNFCNLSFICITETWLKETYPDSLLNIRKFVPHRMDRHDRNGGGVCVFTAVNISLQRHFSVNHPNFMELVWLVDFTHQLILITLYV